MNDLAFPHSTGEGWKGQVLVFRLSVPDGMLSDTPAGTVSGNKSLQSSSGWV
ncbi:hypothetical protein CEB3_c09380 [Peptococcaceae bacterium CEB3]|nr:hypothetical protein CEB3_c09380 [Peptococcaceae bacterium CEB3]